MRRNSSNNSVIKIKDKQERLSNFFCKVILINGLSSIKIGGCLSHNGLFWRVKLLNNGLKRDESINISFTSSSKNNFSILADEELRLSEERFAKAFYSSPVAMAITTLKEYIHLDVNKTWVDIMGYSWEEAIGKTTTELALWVSYIKKIEFRKILSTQGKVHNFEMHFRRKNGKFGTGLTSVEIISMNGEPCLLISVTDITERKEMEEKLIISEREKTGILESITEAFITVDYKRKVTYWNNAAEVMFNKRKADVLGKDIAEVFPSYIESIFNNYIKQLLEKKQPIFFEAQSPKTGRWAEARVYPNPKGMAVYVQDITERKQMEMEITRLDRLNVVGEMAVSICHEMRNPMTTVRGYLQLLRENNKNNQSKEYYDLMIEELDRANSILSEFVSLTKNKMMEFKPSDLNEIIIKSLPLIQVQANSKDHCVRLELHELPEMLIMRKR